MTIYIERLEDIDDYGFIVSETANRGIPIKLEEFTDMCKLNNTIIKTDEGILFPVTDENIGIYNNVNKRYKEYINLYAIEVN